MQEWIDLLNQFKEGNLTAILFAALLLKKYVINGLALSYKKYLLDRIELEKEKNTIFKSIEQDIQCLKDAVSKYKDNAN